MNRILKTLLLISASALVALSCDPVKEDVAVTGVTISPEKDTLVVGETLELVVSVLPEDATNKEYTLDCKSDVVSIENNTVTALKKGTATITAIAAENGKTAVCKITVIEENTDGPGNGEDGPGNGEDGPGNGEDGPGNGEDGPGNGEDKPNVPGAGEDFTETVGDYTFSVVIDGIDVNVDITPAHDRYYYAGVFIKWQADDFGVKFNDLAVDQIKQAMGMGLSFEDACRQGAVSLVYTHDDPNVDRRLVRNEAYYAYACEVSLVDGEPVAEAADVAKVIFQTEERGSYDGEENVITIEATSTASSITVSTKTTTFAEYYITCMKESDYNADFEVSTTEEIMGSLYFRSNSTEEGYAVDNFKVEGDADVTFEGLSSNTSYVICAFGYIIDEDQGLNQSTTKLYKTTVKTSK